ncbi:actin-85C-like [Tachyglossus aculeatus]|uniref:actin-85C-like n=1 Tax=Tachyglossus aculeatus TaxID=9261 RepID=UPI0018F2C63B|nr:actin-85C-like [Tachyglossus aculeatus]
MPGPHILDRPAVILDNGSGLCKAGLSGEQAPRSVLASVVGYPKGVSLMIGAGQKDYYLGKEAQAKRGILSLRYPLRHGIVTAWDDMEKIWSYIYWHELRERPSQQPVLVTEAPQNPHANRARMTEILFESFQVPALYVGLQALMALYSSGRTTGLVLDSGDGVTTTVPVFRGHCLRHGVSRADFAGRDVTTHLATLLLETGHSFVSSAEQEIVRDIKERMCFVEADPTRRRRRRAPTRLRNYLLPDGRPIQVGDQLWRAPEALFDPLGAGVEAPGVHRMAFHSVTHCSRSTHKEIWANVVLSGGSTLFRGLRERLGRELRALAPEAPPIAITAPPNRLYSVWVGASVLASLSSFREMWVTGAAYREFGPSVMQRRCL